MVQTVARCIYSKNIIVYKRWCCFMFRTENDTSTTSSFTPWLFFSTTKSKFQYFTKSLNAVPGICYLARGFYCCNNIWNVFVFFLQFSSCVALSVALCTVDEPTTKIRSISDCCQKSCVLTLHTYINPQHNKKIIKN